MKISVILPSLLRNYGPEMKAVCASRRKEKLVRAISSFLRQTYGDRELILVSDGCDETKKVYNELYSNSKDIHFIQVEHKSLFSGVPRTKGLEISTGDLVCYLDSDDFLGPLHLESVVKQFTPEVSWVYYNDKIVKSFKSFDSYSFDTRNVQICHGSIGTSSFSHRRVPGLMWPEGYGHDWFFIKENFINKPTKKIENCDYNVCHLIIGSVDV
jgi:glycosyltransferase involved in cell wall biosynthesis